MKIKRLLVIGLLIFGMYARFADVGQKVYTVDEVRGLLRASGTTSQAFIESVYTGEPITNRELQKYQTADIDRPLGDALSAFANNPEHPPLYYLLMRFSLQLFQQAAASRWIAVGFSILLLPALYWLCQELFALTAINAAAVGWSAIALVAVSPFHVLLAQEARQYSIWALLAVVSSAFLLRALQQNKHTHQTLSPAQQSPAQQSDNNSNGSPKPNTWIPWIGYGITATLGMYSHLFFTWVLVTHGLYVFIIEKFRPTQKLLRYVVTSIGISIAFLPWVWVVVSRLGKLGQTTKWASTYNSGLLERSQYWLHNLGIGFIDFDGPITFTNPISYLILIAVAYSTYQLYRHTPKRIWLFIILLMAVSTLAQVVPDVLSGGRRSLLPRYSLTAYLGIELAVAWAMAQPFQRNRTQADTLNPAAPNHNKKRITQGKQIAAIALILGGITSSTLITQSLGWGKGSSTLTLKAAPILNQTTVPIILSDADHTYALSLSHQVSPEAQFILLNKEQNPDYTAALLKIPADRDFFIYSASEPMLEFLNTAVGVNIQSQTNAMKSAQIYQAQRQQQR